MPDTEFLVIILLLVAAVAFAYFYLKRAQRRDATVAPPSVNRRGEHDNVAEDE